MLQFASGLLESLSQVAVIAGTVLLLLMVIALVSFVYKSVRGDGIEWPEDQEGSEAESGDGVTEGGDDDEWEYY